MVFNWSPSGPQIVSNWSPSGHQVVLKRSPTVLQLSYLDVVSLQPNKVIASKTMANRPIDHPISPLILSPSLRRLLREWLLYHLYSTLPKAGEETRNGTTTLSITITISIVIEILLHFLSSSLLLSRSTSSCYGEKPIPKVTTGFTLLADAMALLFRTLCSESTAAPTSQGMLNLAHKHLSANFQSSARVKRKPPPPEDPSRPFNNPSSLSTSAATIAIYADRHITAPVSRTSRTTRSSAAPSLPL